MHEPLARDFRLRDARSGALGLFWASALVVIVAMACVGVAAIAGELCLGHDRQAVGGAACSAAYFPDLSTGYLISGMPQP